MLNFIGFLIILISSGKIGFDVSAKYRNRTKQLRVLINALEILKNEIVFSNKVIPDAISTASNVKLPVISDFMLAISECIKSKNISVKDAFLESLKNAEDKLSLKNEDKNILYDLFSVLGTSCQENEITNIDRAISYLTQNMKSSSEEEAKYVKLFRTTGVLAGLVIGVIFI